MMTHKKEDEHDGLADKHDKEYYQHWYDTVWWKTVLVGTKLHDPDVQDDDAKGQMQSQQGRMQPGDATGRADQSCHIG